MGRHEVEVTKLSERIGYVSKKPTSTVGSVVVKPPITASEFFSEVILGRDGHGVKLSQVVTTSEETLFVVGSSLKTIKEREAAIYTVADRIKRLANEPDKVIELLDENPFPIPLEK